MPVTDRDLLNRCIKGDQKSQILLYREVFGLLMAMCRRYYRNREDCTQHVNTAFLKILDNLDTYTWQGTFEAWCSRIMQHTLIDEWRKNRRYNDSHVHDENLNAKADLDQATYNTVEAELEQEALLEMLMELPPTTRYVFNLFAIEGYAHAEIAEQMGMSEGTSRWHVNEARNTLKKLVLKKLNIVPLKKVG